MIPITLEDAKKLSSASLVREELGLAADVGLTHLQ